ncbi:rhamnogalacturonan acetylesterase [Alkalitalea saponilacus]|nr:rhamnogalacturonan acetylesterase [Alkalitalea saponilacus]
MRVFSLIAFLAFLTFSCTESEKPVIYTIGDSTVKNGQGDGAGGLWGWGDPFKLWFDTAKVEVKNHARGGTSSRTYRTLGLWDEVYNKLKKGDYVFIQFGHNDAGTLNDSIRARGTIRGVGDEFEVIDNILTGEREKVYSYGRYLTEYIKEIKAKGATPIIISPIPRNRWEDGKVPRNKDSYGGWAKTVAEREDVTFIDLNEKMAQAMETLGESNVTNVLFFSHDHTHPNAEGAKLAASLVVEGIRELRNSRLHVLLDPYAVINFPVKKRAVLIGDSTVANGRDSIAGWGLFFADFLDTSRIELLNRARGGRSSRTFYSEGLWEQSLELLQEGDFLLIQFGHNDGGAIDQPKFRASIPGIGDDSSDVILEDGSLETVHTYGWYLRRFITDAQSVGVNVIVLSHIPRNRWHKGKVERNNLDYGLWTREVAMETGAYFIDLNERVAIQYEKMGTAAVALIFPKDHTHTNEEGALINARILAKALSEQGSPMRSYILLRDQ